MHPGTPMVIVKSSKSGKIRSATFARSLLLDTTMKLSCPKGVHGGNFVRG